MSDKISDAYTVSTCGKHTWTVNIVNNRIQKCPECGELATSARVEIRNYQPTKASGLDVLIVSMVFGLLIGFIIAICLGSYLNSKGLLK